MLSTEIYPTPCQSPYLKAKALPNLLWEPAEEPPKIQECHQNIALINKVNEITEPNRSCKRKKGVPSRSISKPIDQVDRSFQRIISLDVYAIFKENPLQLLNRKREHSDYDSDSSRPKSPPPRKASIEKSSTSAPSACKALPAFIAQNQPANFNLSAYKCTKGVSPVSWRGAQPLAITNDMPDYENITPEEIKTCATLRILPQQYLEIKRTILTAVTCYGPFKKREAQTWFRIDVNKICIIYDWFKQLGWIPNSEEWANASDNKRTPTEGAKSKKIRRK